MSFPARSLSLDCSPSYLWIDELGWLSHLVAVVGYYSALTRTIGTGGGTEDLI